MVRAITPGEEWVWIHESDLDLPEDEQTRWTLRVLSSTEAAWVQNKVAAASTHQKGGRRGRRDESDDLTIRTGDYRLAQIHAGVVNVENLLKDEKQPDGTVKTVAVPYTTQPRKIAKERREAVSDAFLNQVPNDVLVDLAGAIDEGPRLKERDLKN